MKKFVLLLLVCFIILGCISTPSSTQMKQQYLNACAEGDLITMQQLIDDGVPYDINNGNFNGLHIAANNEQFEVCKYLVTLGIDIDAVTMENKTAAGYAVSNGSSDILEYLLQHGASLNPENAKSLLFISISSDQLDIFTKLINNEKINIKDEKLLLHAALLGGHWSIIPTLLD